MPTFVAASANSPCPHEDEMVDRCQACLTETEYPYDGHTPINALPSPDV